MFLHSPHSEARIRSSRWGCWTEAEPEAGVIPSRKLTQSRLTPGNLEGKVEPPQQITGWPCGEVTPKEPHILKHFLLASRSRVVKLRITVYKTQGAFRGQKKKKKRKKSEKFRRKQKDFYKTSKNSPQCGGGGSYSACAFATKFRLE